MAVLYLHPGRFFNSGIPRHDYGDRIDEHNHAETQTVRGCW